MSLSEEELKTLISLAKRVLWEEPEVRAKLQQNKVNIIPSNFYSEVPSVEEIRNSFEYRTPDEPVYGKMFDPDFLRDFLAELLAYSLEFNPPVEGDRDQPEGFFWANPAFSHLDAMAYYCMIRHFKPHSILEIGSGFSTLVADQAIKHNGFGQIVSIEPYPMAFLREIDSITEIVEQKVQDIPVTELVKMVETADMWFIDSTHTVKIGSDCLYLYLKIMPEIVSRTVVHTHDVYLPQGMHQDNALDKHIYWTEQYLLYAYLLDNPKAQIIFGSYYSHLYLPEFAQKLMHGRYMIKGGSLWYTLN